VLVDLPQGPLAGGSARRYRTDQRLKNRRPKSFAHPCRADCGWGHGYWPNHCDQRQRVSRALQRTPSARCTTWGVKSPAHPPRSQRRSLARAIPPARHRQTARPPAIGGFAMVDSPRQSLAFRFCGFGRGSAPAPRGICWPCKLPSNCPRVAISACAVRSAAENR